MPLSLWLCAVFSLGLPSAKCCGAAAPEALTAFSNDPAAFIRIHKPAGNIGEQLAAFASAAINERDVRVGKGVGRALSAASADQGKAICAALANIGQACTDQVGLADPADHGGIFTDVVATVATEQAASTADGLALEEPQTVLIGDGSAGGRGSSGFSGQIGPSFGFGVFDCVQGEHANALPMTPPRGGTSENGGGGSGDATLSTLILGIVLTGAYSVSAG